MTLGEAVLALQARGFGKTAAYKALSAQSKFGDLIENTPDGLVEEFCGSFVEPLFELLMVDPRSAMPPRERPQDPPGIVGLRLYRGEF